MLVNDPTRTITLRSRFVAEMNRRFKKLTDIIHESVVTNDCFGLEETPRITIQAAAQPGQFAFPRSADKVEGFMQWLSDQNEEFILSGGRRGIRTISRAGGGVVSGADAWTSVYIESAYQRGIKRGRAELRKAGVDIPDFGDTPGRDPITVAFNQPFHADRVGLLYTRTFNDLKGITTAMEGQVSRVLAQGLAEGRNPRDIGRMLNMVVTGDGLSVTDTLGRFIPARRRAQMLARTEVIRAHHVASINEYRQAGIEGVKVKAELSTAGDGAVCVICASLEMDTQAKPATLDEIEGMIPVHPNCRCVAIPVVK
ncbi:MAG: phage head morphogenesis protein [Desulfobulbaceae bacterium]|nr:phage head morphogenesis protein [Desulfobulbaceae bacterium]